MIWGARQGRYSSLLQPAIPPAASDWVFPGDIGKRCRLFTRGIAGEARCYTTWAQGEGRGAQGAEVNQVRPAKSEQPSQVSRVRATYPGAAGTDRRPAKAKTATKEAGPRKERTRL